VYGSRLAGDGRISLKNETAFQNLETPFLILEVRPLKNYLLCRADEMRFRVERINFVGLEAIL
jgi:hypothetical protein